MHVPQLLYAGDKDIADSWNNMHPRQRISLGQVTDEIHQSVIDAITAMDPRIATELVSMTMEAYSLQGHAPRFAKWVDLYLKLQPSESSEAAKRVGLAGAMGFVIFNIIGMGHTALAEHLYNLNLLDVNSSLAAPTAGPSASSTPEPLLHWTLEDTTPAAFTGWVVSKNDIDLAVLNSQQVTPIQSADAKIATLSTQLQQTLALQTDLKQSAATAWSREMHAQFIEDKRARRVTVEHANNIEVILGDLSSIILANDAKHIRLQATQDRRLEKRQLIQAALEHGGR